MTQAHFDTLKRDEIANHLGAIASQAGAAIMAIYDRGFEVIDKLDGSPLTDADLAADTVIAAGLSQLAPHVPLLSEETVDTVKPEDLGERFFVVDPLDGTKEFISRNGDFTVNIALVDDAQPICGVVYAPARGRIWLAGDTARVANLPPGDDPDLAALQTIKCVTPPPETLRAVASRSHHDAVTEAYLASLGPCETVSVGSSLKLCLVAEGQADVYPRVGPTMVWDTAAGIAVVESAGGVVVGQNNQPMRVAFGQDDWRNGPFVVWGCSNRSREFPLTLPNL